MTQARMPNCRLKATRVCQMLVGDSAQVEPNALFADRKDRVYVRALALLGTGSVVVVKEEDGYHVDVSRVPSDYRWPRLVWWKAKVYRVKSVTGAVCR